MASAEAPSFSSISTGAFAVRLVLSVMAWGGAGAPARRATLPLSSWA
jgi:hypothetical protein